MMCPKCLCFTKYEAAKWEENNYVLHTVVSLKCVPHNRCESEVCPAYSLSAWVVSRILTDSLRCVRILTVNLRCVPHTHRELQVCPAFWPSALGVSRILAVSLSILTAAMRDTPQARGEYAGHRAVLDFIWMNSAFKIIHARFSLWHK